MYPKRIKFDLIEVENFEIYISLVVNQIGPLPISAFIFVVCLKLSRKKITKKNEVILIMLES